MSDLLTKLFDAITGILPIHKWLDATTNALRGIVASLVLLALMAVVFAFALSGTQQFVGLMAILAVFALVALSLVALAFYNSGRGLYDPYQQSLFRGRRFGTSQAPKLKREIVEEPGEKPPATPIGQALPAPVQGALPPVQNAPESL